MKTQKPFLDRISTLKNLPTLPHILLKLFEACNRDITDLEEIAAIAGKDPALSAKFLKLVNSAYFGLPQKVKGINQAVVLIGTSGIKNMAICACVYEAFPRPKRNGIFNLKTFWWHSLRCAFLSKNIATKTKFVQPDEAFASGLLHDIGKVVLWVNFYAEYENILEKCFHNGSHLIEEEAHLGATHCEVAAWLLDRWNFQTEIADSVRYHHEDPDRISQALPFTQIIYIANLLCQDAEARTNEGLRLAQKILRVNGEECLALIKSADEEAKDVADALGIDVNVDEPGLQTPDENDHKIQETLVQDVRNVSLTIGILEGFLTAEGENDILSSISDGLNILLDVNRFLYFLVDTEKKVLCGYSRDQEGRYSKTRGLTISMNLDQSLLVRAINENKSIDSFNAGVQGPLTILDEQIIRLIGGQGIYCVPLIAHGDPVGVLVLAIQKSDLPHLLKNKKLLKIFIHKGALALRLNHLKRSQLHDIQAKRADASSDLARRVVHEINNPLSIIKNYLKILEIKFPEEKVPRDEVRIINEEINRVSNLLKKLTDFSTENAPKHEMADIHALLMDIVKLTRDSLLRHSDVKLQTDFEKDLPSVRAEKAALKQVFINLIKNAAEAMQSGGTLCIKTRCIPPPIGSRRMNGKTGSSGYVEIQFIDDGPGIPEAIKDKLFDPYVSSKEDGDSGLGLSIAYNIIKSFKGIITCESVMDKGTVFKIELPIQGNS
jgi:nitrogen-specific signal transduction histidine kinase/HD-like signal output (HDOD) protein